MKLTSVIKIWDLLHVRDTGELGFCDLEKAIDEIEGVENDVPAQMPEQLPCKIIGQAVLRNPDH